MPFFDGKSSSAKVYDLSQGRAELSAITDILGQERAIAR
jgi:hypothetical protein